MRMKQRLAGSVVIASLALVCCTPTLAQGGPGGVTANYAKLIDPLVTEKDLGSDYVEEGATADATVLLRKTPHGVSADTPNLIPPLENIINAKQAALPILIRCLTDIRLTSITFEGGFNWGKPFKVPVGYVCQDILLHLVGKNRLVLEKECFSDELGACYRRGFYFRPDDYVTGYHSSRPYRVRPWILEVQRNWRRLLVRKAIRFHYPKEWQS